MSRSADSADAYLAETLTDEVAGALAATRAVRVVRSATSGGAAIAVSGSVQRARDLLRVAVRVERTGTGEVRWAGQVASRAGDAQVLRDSLIARIFASLGLRPAAPRSRTVTTDPVTYDLWARAHYLLPRRRQQDVATTASLLGRALARDSGFAPAWADLARVLIWARSYGLAVPGVPADSLLPRTLDASERALLLDSTDADAWRLRASVASLLDPTSRRIGLAALARALALDSLDGPTWDQYALALAEAGDQRAAATAWRRAARLEPGQPLDMYAYHWFWERLYDSAAAWADAAVAQDPTRMFYRELAAEVALARGRLAEAAAGYETALRLGTGPEQVRALGGLAIVRATAGDTAEARRLIARAEAVSDSATPTLHAALSIAEAYVAVGDQGRALAWLERYRPRGDLHFQLHLARDPTLDPLRGLPAFRSLLTGS